MKKKIIIGIVLVIIIITGIIIFSNNKKCNTNALEFKKEYEKYNTSLVKLSISDDNPMVKMNKQNIIKKIDSSNGILFFGNPKNNDSRTLIKELLKVARDYDCEIIYYYDINDLKDNNVYDELQTKLGEYSLKNNIVIFYKKGEITKYQEYVKDIKGLDKNLVEGFDSISGGMCEVAKQC